MVTLETLVFIFDDFFTLMLEQNDTMSFPPRIGTQQLNNFVQSRSLQWNKRGLTIGDQLELEKSGFVGTRGTVRSTTSPSLRRQSRIDFDVWSSSDQWGNISAADVI